MSDRKILFIDVDGTLLNYENRLPPSARAAIRAARANGHRVYICTGRSEAEVYESIWEIGLDGMIGGNGAYVRDGGQVVLWKHISAEQCRRVVDWLHGRGLEFYLEALDRQKKKDNENPSVGIILCASKDDEIVEYAMSRTLSPMMVAEYQLQLPDKNILQKKLQELYNTPLLNDDNDE